MINVRKMTLDFLGDFDKKPLSSRPEIISNYLKCIASYASETPVYINMFNSDSTDLFSMTKHKVSGIIAFDKEDMTDAMILIFDNNYNIYFKHGIELDSEKWISDLSKEILKDPEEKKIIENCIRDMIKRSFDEDKTYAIKILPYMFEKTETYQEICRLVDASNIEDKEQYKDKLFDLLIHDFIYRGE